MLLVEGDNLSSAWLAAVRALLAAAGRELTDLIVKIARPWEEDKGIRAAAERLDKKWSIETSANTIFPRSYGRLGQAPERLAERYAVALPRLQREWENRHGTYFGQLVLYKPRPDAAPINQLAIAVRRAREARPLRNVYDMVIAVPGRNTRPMGFPCLAYLNFKINDANELLLTAHYRNHYFIGRAYGNYLGLARLQAYLATQMQVTPGAMICISGRAKLDGSITAIRQMLARLDK